MKKKIYKILIVSSTIVASIVSALFIGGAILGQSVNYLAWTFFGGVVAWTLPVGISYAFGERDNKIMENYVTKIPSQFKCNDGVIGVKKTNDKVLLVDYDKIGINYERNVANTETNVKVRKRTRNDFK